MEVYCAPDDWFATGVVNSIYFDTPGLTALAEKLNGDNLKTKIRIRWYGKAEELPQEVPVFLEIKYRVGSARRKKRYDVIAPRELVIGTELDDPKLVDFLRSHAGGLGDPVSQAWHPVCVIQYNRRRYFDTPTMSRISIDWDIRAERFNRSLFPQGRPIRLDSMVCEFKNKGGMPPRWAEEMRRAGMNLGAFSKYGECMRRLTTGEI